MPRTASSSTSATPRARGKKKPAAGTTAAKKQTSILDGGDAKPEWSPRAPAPEEALPDGTTLLRFTIPGQPATKKTSQRIFRGRIMPSVQYCEYEDRCEHHCIAAWVGQGASAEQWRAALEKHRAALKKDKKKLEGDPWLIAPNWVTNQPMDFGVVMCMRVFLHTWQVGDCTGYQQSVADILQKFGVLANDSWLHWDWEGGHWFGGVDKENPRIEVTIKRFRHPKEAYRANQEAEELAKRERARIRAEKAAQKAVQTASEGDKP